MSYLHIILHVSSRLGTKRGIPCVVLLLARGLLGNLLGHTKRLAVHNSHDSWVAQ
jgi:hypothetical protein